MTRTTSFLLLVAAFLVFAISDAIGQTATFNPLMPDGQADVDSGSFSSESHLGNNDLIRKQDGQVTNIQNGTWIAFKKFNFGSSLAYLWIEGASANTGGTVEFRVGSATGALIGTVTIRETGGWDIYKPVGLKLPRAISGVNDLYLTFAGGSGNLFNLAKFRFQRLSPDYVSPTAVVAPETAVLPNGYTLAGSFTTESNPGDDNKVRAEGGKISYIQNGSWVTYKDFDFGSEPKYFEFDVASESSQNKLELRVDEIDGPLVASIEINSTGSFKTFRTLGTALKRPLKGVHDLYFKFMGGGGYIYDVGSFRFLNVAPGLKLPTSTYMAAKFEKESHPTGEPVVIKDNEVTSIQNGSWIAYSNFEFGEQTDLITLEAATPSSGGVVEVRTETANGPLIGTVNVGYTGSWSHYRPFTAALSQSMNGRHHLFFKFVSPDGSADSLFNLRSFVFGRKPPKPVSAKENRLNVYPAVPGLAPSPYYTFAVQKQAALNDPRKENATNWEQPFAWFTRCIDAVPNRESAYYEEFIGGWSHTYCNFEVDEDTAIVVKISRLNKPGAPSGPIAMANVHPAHKVTSCEIINGEVYVTMNKPALVAVDIDGQLDTRDAPRLIPNKWGSEPFPFNNELNGAHGVTIFANPVIEDKPSLTDASVFAVKPGMLPPSDGSWKTLYFLPGVHKLSVDANNDEREWVGTDPIFLRNNKSYYIPGDAILYGNMNDLDDNLDSVNIRVFGHGTISGTKMPHWKDFSSGELPGSEHKKLRMMQLTRASNCSYEGVTIADPAEHGAYIQGYGFNHAANKISWLKNISWRVNNDGGGVTGNGYVEDCFFRHQDDALYVRGVAIRRCVLWSDVNGTPFRCSFITNDRAADFPKSLPQDLVVEDCDVIYTRGVFASETSADFGVIGTPGAFDETKKFADGTINTGQHLVFRNIRVTDPRPVRYLLGFNATGDASDSQKTPWAGLRFENIEYRHPQTWGWKNHLLGSNLAPITYWLFDGVSVNGKRLDAKLFADPRVFNTKNVSSMIFK
jgi:hypothetical protein